MITAPARRRLATTGLSCAAKLAASATTPLVVGRPAWSTLTLVVIGTPCSGPTGWPSATARSAASAAARAASACTDTMALTPGFTASIRARQDSVASRLLNCLVLMPAASAVAVCCQRGADMRVRSSGVDRVVPGRRCRGRPGR